VRDQYNERLVFPPDQRAMFVVSRSSIAGTPTQAMARRLRLWSLSWNARLVVDSAFSFDFNDGAMALLELDPTDDLRTAVLV
jgi:hypothetical protein